MRREHRRPARVTPRAWPRYQVALEPAKGQAGRLFQGAGLFEKVSRAGGDSQLLFRPQQGQGLPIRLEYPARRRRR